MSTKTPKTKFGKQMLYILLPFVLPITYQWSFIQIMSIPPLLIIVISIGISV